MFSCPFISTDSRGFKDVKIVVKRQAISRKHIRTALHNLYADNYSLSAFVNNIITTANASTFKPFPSDAAWLAMYAKYLDGILLNALEGPWSLWNEAWLDDITVAFLELIVHVSVNKEYPSCLDDKVRKWMKKRCVGVDTKYGPVTLGMQQAKITENNLQFFQGYKQGSKELKSLKSSLSSPLTKQGGVPSPSEGKSK